MDLLGKRIMPTKHLANELLDLATIVSNLLDPNDLTIASQLVAASEVLADQRSLPGFEEEPADPRFANGEEYLENTLEVIGKGNRAWWLPPHNLVLNQALTNYNLWYFTILPSFPNQTAYRDNLKGIVIHPIWRPVQHQGLGDMDLATAKKVVSLMQRSNTIQEDVRKELSWIESKFSIRIPDAVQSRIVKDALATANRRWGVNRLRVKDRLIPLDGSPPKDLGALDS